VDVSVKTAPSRCFPGNGEIKEKVYTKTHRL